MDVREALLESLVLSLPSDDSEAACKFGVIPVVVLLPTVLPLQTRCRHPVRLEVPTPCMLQMHTRGLPLLFLLTAVT